MPHKIYLGDSVYASHDGFMITLSTENGYGPSNTIHLEPEVLNALIAFAKSLSNENDRDIETED